MKGKLFKTLKRTLCYLLVLGMVAGSAIPAQAEESAKADITDGLLAHYDFESVTGTSVTNKANADAYTGTLSGSASISESLLGNSLKLGTAAGGMQLTDIVNASTSSFSVSMWYKADSTSSSNVNLVQAGTMGGSTGRTILILNPSAKYYTYVTGDDTKATTSTSVTPTEWQHVTFVYDKDNSKAYFYVNGAADNEAGITLSGSALDTADMIIGRHRNANEGQFNGLIDEVRVYNKAVSAAEAEEIYMDKAGALKITELQEAITEAEALLAQGDLAATEAEAVALAEAIADAKELDSNSSYDAVVAAIATLSEATAAYEAAASAVSPIILTIDPDSVERTVDDSIFGINHRYAFNGYGTFDTNLWEVKDEFQELYEEAGFGSIRYPGGTISNLFNWKTTLDAVGRVDQIHGFYNYSGQGGIAPNFGIKEIADFADEVGSEIVYVYSLGRGSANDAADLIEYLNAEVGCNPNGGIDWAQVRSENGHPEPYNVRYFEIGNEMNQGGTDGSGSQQYWLPNVSTGAETAYIEGGLATFTKQYAVLEGDWNQVTSVSDGSANMVRYMRYANVNPKTYDENGNIVDDEEFVAVSSVDGVYVGSEQWGIVTSFENSSATDKHVVVDFATGALIFGDGVNGAIPAAGQQIYVSYTVPRDGLVAISEAMKDTTDAINKWNEEHAVDAEHEAYIYSSYETSGFITKMSSGGYNDLYDGLTIHPYSGGPSGSGASYYDSAMSLAESAGVGKVQNYVNMLPEGKVPVISEYGIFRSTDELVRSQTHAIYIAKVLMEYVRLGSPYIQKHCLVDWYSSGADALGPTQQAVIQAVAQNGANTKTGEGDFAFFSTPSARVFQMLNSSFGTDILEISYNREETLSNGVKAYSSLASKDEYDNYYAAFVNVDRENAKALEIVVDGLDLTGADVEIQMLSTESYADQNTLEDPDNVAVETTTTVAAKGTVTVVVPKHSFAVVKISTGVDKTALEDAIAAAAKLVESEYTADSWKAADLAAAIAAAEAVLNDTDATKEDVEEAIADLTEAVAKLERISVDKAALEAKIAEASALSSTDYTGDSWNALQLAVSAAKNIAAKENATQEMVDNALEQLTEALAGLQAVIPVSDMVAISDSEYTPGTANEGPDDYILDGDSSTHWHTNWQTTEGTNVEKRWIGVSLNETTEIAGIQYLPRTYGGSNGAVTEYKVQYRATDDGEWINLASGTWSASDSSWKTVTFETVLAKQVRVVGVHTSADSGNDAHMSCAEFRLLQATDAVVVDKTALKAAITAAEALNADDYKDFTAVTAALETAKTILANEDATQAAVNAAAKALNAAVAALEEKEEEPPVEEKEVVRIAGAGRIDTALEIADTLKETLGLDLFETVIIATSKTFADALPGSYLAYVENAPILLISDARMDDVVAYVKANLKDGGKVYILGGEAAVSASLEGKLAGYDVDRLAGAGRYETNMMILDKAGVTGGEIIVATGKSFADSLSASAAKLPILMVKDSLNADQKALLAAMNVEKFYIVGGESAVSAKVADELAAYAAVERVAGANRRETSIAVAQKFFENPDMAVVASASNFPDGLCGGPLAAALNAPLILTVDGKTTEAAAYTAELGIEAGYVLGGTGVLADDSVVNVFGLESAADIILK